MFTGGFDVMLYVKDLRGSLELYRDAFGFEAKGFWSDSQERFVETWEEEGEPGYVELSAGGTKITLHASDGDVSGGGAIYHFEVEDVDAFQRRAVENGVDASEPKDFPWGWRMCFVKDPDGHHFGFYRPSSAAS
ncbi:MAG: VOC family protein [Planctomycetota bacterium]|jgi:uncharacterized glyoxalase superfamily protein PhnB